MTGLIHVLSPGLTAMVSLERNILFQGSHRLLLLATTVRRAGLIIGRCDGSTAGLRGLQSFSRKCKRKRRPQRGNVTIVRAIASNNRFCGSSAVDGVADGTDRIATYDFR